METVSPDNSNQKYPLSRDIVSLAYFVWIISYVSNLFFCMHCIEIGSIMQFNVYKGLEPLEICIFNVIDTSQK